ncbi:MAG: NADPH-dependent FMN reductase [Nannocystaceae bacterium]
MSTRIAVVSGSSRLESHVHDVVLRAATTARSAGAEVREVILHALRLPLMDVGSPEQALLPAVQEVREVAAWAEGFVIVTPEYHGNMSGCLKNWFDFLWEELAGKFAGVVAVTGGGCGDMSITAVKNSFSWCHGFTLPFHAAARSGDFEGGELSNPRVIERVDRIAFDVVRYAPVIRRTWEAARAEGIGITAGVAGLHG